jgi:hypothetical protein
MLGVLTIISGAGRANPLSTPVSQAPTATRSNQGVTTNPNPPTPYQALPTQNIVTVTTVPVSSAPAATPTATFPATPTLKNSATIIDLSPTTTPGITVAQATPTPLLINKLTPAASQTTLSGNLKLSPEERTVLLKLDTDINGLNASINRLDLLMTDPHPEQPGWFEKLGKEIGYWQDLANYYKTNQMPQRVGSQVMPVWLSALARLGRAGKVFPAAYHSANGIAISQADQEVAFAELEISRTSIIMMSLRQK